MAGIMVAGDNQERGLELIQVLGGLFKKIGINSHTFYRGRNASLFSSMKPFTPAEHINLMQNMQHTYEIFKNCVVQSRGEKLTEPIEYLAQGKIYTGQQAKNVGLIDEIGTFDQAIQMAAEQVGIDKYHIRILPTPKTLIEVLADLLAKSEEQTDEPTARLGLAGFPLENQALLNNASNLNHSFILQKIFNHISSIIYLLQQEHTLLVLPYEIIVPPFN